MTNKGMLELCKIYYDKETFKHAKRVANEAKYLVPFFKLPYDNWENFVYQLGLAHDLYEDTNIAQNTWFDYDFEKNLQLLTHKKYSTYNSYLYDIKETARNDKRLMPAFIVKLADIYDHFNESATLTEELKNKYIQAIPYLL